ncbi:helicase HerA domain-containing protein [Nonomuraea sp. NPDC059194]|uniref:helicase HerA domain-containing protein n=1 Tax=Nonomuraea sp. NPDC059194 TaxID=3346764 RepID=UPI00367DA7C0
MTAEWEALAALRLNAVHAPDDVWRPSPYHVESLHRVAAHDLRRGVAEAKESLDASPIGVVIQGQRGTGKTHLLGWAREHAQREGGYFFLVGLLDARSFWDSIVIAMLDSLWRPVDDGQSQLRLLLNRLAQLADVPRMVRRAVDGRGRLDRGALDLFVEALRRKGGTVLRDAHDTARALVLLASDDLAAQDVGQAYLTSVPDEGLGKLWGLTRGHRSPQEVVRDLSRLLALTGPSVIAVDQVDTLVAQSGSRLVDEGQGVAIEQVAGGLMALRDVTRRTLTVLSCLPTTWMLIREQATDTVRDRFREPALLRVLKDAPTARAIVERRFVAGFERAGFVPPYPTWPVKESAFDSAVGLTPRQILVKIDRHVQACLAEGEVRELDRLDEPGDGGDAAAGPPSGAGPSGLAALDAHFALLRERAEVETALDPATEDAVMPGLLSAGLTAWISGRGGQAHRYAQDPPPSRKPPLHARLRLTLDEATEDEVHWCFRGIASTSPVAALHRLRAACVTSGLRAGVPRRQLFVLRNAHWSGGPKTKETLASFEAAGGRVLQVDEADLRTLWALRTLLDEEPPHLQEWLTARRPADDVKLLVEALRQPTGEPPRPAPPAAPPAAEPPRSGLPAAEPSRPGAAGDPEVTRPIATAPPAATPTPPSTAPPVTAPRDADLTSSPPAVTGLAAAPADRVPSSDAAASERVPADAAVSDGIPSPNVAASERVPSADAAVSDGVPSRNVAVSEGVPYPSVAVSDRCPSTDGDGTLVVGRRADGAGPPARIELAALRKHTVIFAGSGSGKTVLIRRLIEECALQGVSAIVLDPNNDLSRLGTAWPSPPTGWEDGDRRRAAAYLAGTDVVVWTPGMRAGRPLTFQPLPDLGALVGDPDEFRLAIDAAVAALAPKARIDGPTAKAHRSQAVLRKAMAHHAKTGSHGLRGLIALLSELPDGVSDLDGAAKLAAEVAQNLRAAIINDPLFGGEGTPVDPGVLLTPERGRRARVSVINLAGLQEDSQRQSFVNRLQLGLFAWFRRHPAHDRPLGGLLVMDEAQTFAPQGKATPATGSTLMLAAQARKYGLGLVFATQAPKGLHNHIPGNAATQFFGFLNAPIQRDAAQEMARAKGGVAAEIGRLRAGQFYVAAEGAGFHQIRVPMCLSHHPAAPPTSEEVLTLARP